MSKAQVFMTVFYLHLKTMLKCSALQFSQLLILSADVLCSVYFTMNTPLCCHFKFNKTRIILDYFDNLIFNLTLMGYFKCSRKLWEAWGKKRKWHQLSSITGPSHAIVLRHFWVDTLCCCPPLVSFIGKWATEFAFLINSVSLFTKEVNRLPVLMEWVKNSVQKL